MSNEGADEQARLGCESLESNHNLRPVIFEFKFEKVMFCHSGTLSTIHLRYTFKLTRPHLYRLGTKGAPMHKYDKIRYKTAFCST